ncbi:MAG: hypothetical protein EOO29_24735 [Comamonadaceae bacterium]|nr:MAG: hypothetical protein EOO29_24735 [Comamonadaceae bacterium]
MDGFSGPWQAGEEEYQDTSFGIALAALRKVKDEWKRIRGRDVRMTALLVDKSARAFSRLQSTAQEDRTSQCSERREKALHLKFFGMVSDVCTYRTAFTGGAVHRQLPQFSERIVIDDPSISLRASHFLVAQGFGHLHVWTYGTDITLGQMEFHRERIVAFGVDLDLVGGLPTALWWVGAGRQDRQARQHRHGQDLGHSDFG